MKNSASNFNFSHSDGTAILPRTDLACESDFSSRKSTAEAIRYTLCGIPVSELSVKDEKESASLGRQAGRYVTLHCPDVRYLSADELFSVTDALSSLIVSLTESAICKRISHETKVLVAGLGNRFISADAIGPRTADKISITGHMPRSGDSGDRGLFSLIGCASLCAVHPGVMGQTGIEAAAMIKGAAKYATPDVIIAVDSLAARSTSRLGCTVQLSDTGIEPGSGIGNRRYAVNRSTMGCPVIAIGVPTVVDCATLVFDTLERAGKVDSVNLSLEKERELFVSLRDCDAVCEKFSDIIAAALNRAFLCEGL